MTNHSNHTNCSPELNEFVEAYKSIEKAEKEKENELTRQKKEREDGYKESIRKAQQFVRTWDTWIEPAAEEARAAEEVKRKLARDEVGL